MNGPAFEVHPYDIDRLVRVIATASCHSSVAEIRAKRHLAYLQDYLETIGAQTLVVEHDYIDRDFLEDYAAYYVRCFQPYRKSCTRIHFFRESFPQDALEKCIATDAGGISAEVLAGSYLGFMVIKPLPERVIGRTCLTTYPSDGTRSFPAARAFEANLFGIPLPIARSLPFQEQDRMVSACATSALWTVFQATARQFQHQLLSPYEITRAATHLMPIESRAIPNHGLSLHMMAQAIRNVSLEPFLIRVTTDYLLQTAIYSYLHAGIPLLLGVDLVRGNVKDGYMHNIGKHAIAVSGYNVGKAPTPITSSGLLLRSSCIDKIYAHDDQLGPFARLRLDTNAIVYRDGRGGQSTAQLSLVTSYPAEDGTEIRAVPDLLLVPLYHKIRIPADWAIKRVAEIDAFLRKLSGAMHELNLHALEWDIYLTLVNDAREQVRGTAGLDPKRRQAALTRPMPRFLWRATALRGGASVIDVFFDATDVDTGDALVQVLVLDDEVRGLLKELAEAAQEVTMPWDKNERRFIEAAARGD